MINPLHEYGYDTGIKVHITGNLADYIHGHSAYGDMWQDGYMHIFCYDPENGTVGLCDTDDDSYTAFVPYTLIENQIPNLPELSSQIRKCGKLNY